MSDGTAPTRPLAGSTAPVAPTRAATQAPTAAQALAQALARQVRTWSLAAGAEAETAQRAAQAAQRVSLAASEGHVCVQLDPTGAEAQALRASGVVGTAAAPGNRPLVLDAAGRLYPHRAFAHEQALARRIRAALADGPHRPDRPDGPDAPVSAAGDGPAGAAAESPAGTATESPAGAAAESPASAAAQPAPGAAATATAKPTTTPTAPAAGPTPEPDEQDAAVAHALRHRFSLISGGPGSGKTTSVARLLARVLRHEPQARVALAAPTGKAAARLAESLQQRAASLPQAERVRWPGTASTVHRLLGWRPDLRTHGGFEHHAGRPLALDWLVVDEASMLDLALARRLLDAVPPHAHVLLLGDAHQLAAVEAGAVFAELAGLPQPRLAVHLARSHRFGAGSAIGRLARCVLAGDADAALHLLATDGSALHWQPEAALDLHTIEAAWLPYAQTLRGLAAVPQAPSSARVPAAEPGGAAGLGDATGRTNPTDPAHQAHRAHQALARCRVLAATRHGPRGVLRLNQHLDAWMRHQLGAAPREAWYAGRPVLVTRNQPELDLYNGELGVALRSASQRPGPGGLQPTEALRVHMADRPGLAPLPPGRMAELESAYAMTVHKAQGSEADEVLLVLPEPPNPLLTRELLYTALTRARQRVQVLASEAALRAAIATPTRRDSGLAEAVARGG